MTERELLTLQKYHLVPAELVNKWVTAFKRNPIQVATENLTLCLRASFILIMLGIVMMPLVYYGTDPGTILFVSFLFACSIFVILVWSVSRSAFGSDWLMLGEAFGKPLGGFYEISKEQAKNLAEERLILWAKGTVRWQNNLRDSNGSPEEYQHALKECEMRRNEFRSMHGIFLKFGLVEEKWDKYFAEAKKRLEKEPINAYQS